MRARSRREFIRDLGVSAACLPLVSGLPGLGWAASETPRQRLVIMFSPNGTVPPKFWPDEVGEDFQLKEILQPLEAYKDRLLLLKGVSNKVRGDGDSHMRGMSCLLTGIELFPGNIQGGSHTPAGWASGISIDQEIARFLQSRPETRTRFGSLELGVVVPDRADPWTRMVYAGPNKPVAPIDDPYQLFEKMYGRLDDQESLQSVLDLVAQDLKKVSSVVSSEDRRLLEEHQTLVRELETELRAARGSQAALEMPSLEAGVKNDNDQMPQLSRMQIELLMSGFRNDLARVATLQYTNSVGQARMKWLGIDEGHHSLSHDPDLNEPSQDKLTRINIWFCEQLASLVRQLDETPEPGSEGSMLDHTLIIWTNELGKGNSHTLNDIPFLLVGGGFGFQMGRSLKFDRVAHNRLLLALAHAVGHRLETFGNPRLCEGGPLAL